MSWSYSGDPAASDLDEVRFLVGDTDTTDQLVSNEEVAWSIANSAGTIQAAATLCEALASKFAREVDKSIGSLSVSAASRSGHFSARAAALRVQAIALCEVFVGGLSISGKQALDLDADAVQPAFRVGQDDNPRAGGTTDDEDGA